MSDVLGLIKHVLNDQIFPREELPMTEITSDGIAYGSIELQVPIDTTGLTIAQQVWRLEAPTTMIDQWSRLQPELYHDHTDCLDSTYCQLDSGYYKIEYVFSPATLSPRLGGDQFSVEIFVNPDTTALIRGAAPKSLIRVWDDIAFTGITGILAPTGSVFQGETGVQGCTGIRGTTGVQGTTGIPGLTGLHGITGIYGETGVQGLTGLANFYDRTDYPAIGVPPVLLWNEQDEALFVGLTGGAWIQISSGSLQGITGIQGLQGITGIQGGGTGLQGITGLALGSTGISGPTGIQGQTGISLQGGTGIQGETGIKGSTGIQGSTGIAGGTGIKGSTGIQAYPLVTSVVTSTTPTPNANTTDIYVITALATDATFGSPTGSPNNGQTLSFRVYDNGSAHNLIWNAIYVQAGVTLPNVTVPGSYTYVGSMFNSESTKWDVLAVGQT